MDLKLNYIPNIEYFLGTVNRCSGHIFLELKDQSCLNLKGNGEGKFYLESIGSNANGLHVLAERREDAYTLLEALNAS